MDIFSVEHLWKKTETTYMLKEISFTIKEGEWLLISGPVGEGKESLQKIMLGFDIDWEGSIVLKGKNIKEINNLGAEIAFINNAFVEEKPSQRIYDYLVFPLRVKGKTEEDISQEIRFFCSQFPSLIDLEKKMVDLSLQEKVIIAFLKAAIQKPNLIVIDEPFYQFTNCQRKIIYSTFKDNLRNWKGCPVVIFSSYVLEWVALCDTIAVIYGKTLIQKGTPRQLLENPKHLFITSYLDNERYTVIKGVLNKNHFISNGFSYRLPSEILEDQPFFEGQQLFICIEATSFKIVDAVQDNDGITLEIPIQILKESNDEFKIYSNIGGQPLVAQVIKSGKMNEGNQVQLYFPFKKILFFDGITKKKIFTKR